MKRAAIIINAYSQLKHSLNQSERLKSELEKLGVSTDILRNGSFDIRLDGGKIVSGLIGYDFCVYLDKDKYLSAMLEKAGMRLFNRHSAIEVCDDKMTTFITLSGSGIPMPDTLPAPLCYDKGVTPSRQLIDNIERRFGYPVIVKQSYGSLGKGVFKADDRTQLETLAEKFMCEPHLFQRYIAESAGRDMRVIVIGGKCVAAMERRAECDFRSNIELGGKGTPAQVPQDVALICERAAEILELDYCGTDILFGKDGPMLCEVNSNAFFGGIEGVTGKNIAKMFAQHMYDTIYRR